MFARALGATGYDDYAVAVSSAVILPTLAEMGTGKYALRVMPAYAERWQRSAIILEIVAKSTDKLFLPTVSTMLEREDHTGLILGRRGRWAWLGSICVGFLLTVFLFGKPILALFGQEFVEGYPALCIVVVGTTPTVLAHSGL